MKKIFPLLVLIALITGFFSYSQSAEADISMAIRLSGRILLQVEEHGEAWYVYPRDFRRYYLGRPYDAWNIMRNLGLGITNADLARIPTKDVDWDGEAGLINRLKGYILLQVEEHGEAWYVSPVNGKRYYLGRPDDAFSIMRFLGLGITNKNLFEINPNIEISYIHYLGAGIYEPDEYVEIVNYGKIPQEFKDWILSDEELNMYMFSKDFVLEPYQRVKIYTNYGKISYNSGKAIWDNDHDLGVLVGTNGTLIDFYIY